MAANFAKLLEDDGFLAVFNKRSVEIARCNAIGVVLIAGAVLWRKAAARQRRINRLGDPSRRTARNALAPQPWRMKRRRGTQAVEGIKGGPETDGSTRRSTKATATAMMAMCCNVQ